MVTRSDYTGIGVEAARAVLLELAHLLRQYRDDIVVIGGWVPPLLFADALLPHTGSLDVDIALDHRRLEDAGYQTIHRLLVSRGYYREPDDQPFRYYRKVSLSGREVVVEVDFLAGEYEGPVGAIAHRKYKRCGRAKPADAIWPSLCPLRCSSQAGFLMEQRTPR